MRVTASLTPVLAVIAIVVVLTTAEPPVGGGGGNSGQNTRGNPRNNPCRSVRCQNGGYCDTLNSNRARCVCPTGYSGPNCQNVDQDRTGNSCANLRCENGGRCDTDGTGTPHCHCTQGYSGARCEKREGSNQPPQTITHLRCDSACSTATSCRICLPCDTCQYQTMCLAYEILVKSLDAECHAQGYQEALLMRSTNSPLGYAPIKCRGPGPTRDCPEGSTCVDDGKGGATCCRSPVGREQLENKQGYCPARSEPQKCGRLSCRNDIDCAGNLKCCQQCDYKCTSPSQNPPIVFENPCLNFNCQNGGRCVFPADAPYCECPTGYTGSRCENRAADPCQTFRCLNGGRCFIQGGEPSCECPRDYRGPRCGIREEPCRNFRCENGGRCVTRGDEPLCQCLDGFRGPRCGVRDAPQDPCQSVRCQNGGRCRSQGSSAVCDCPRGYSGPSCENAVPQDPCQSVRCQNGGRCRSQGSSAICDCPRGYSGPSCENAVLQTTRPTTQCQLFGTCNDKANELCGGCPRGWTCQSIQSPCPTLNCPSRPTYRCVSAYKKK